MDKQTTATASATVGFPVASLAVFVMVVMKVGNIAGFGSVSWFWVFSPYLIAIAVVVAFLLFMGIIFGLAFGIAWVFDTIKRRKRRKALEAKMAARK